MLKCLYGVVDDVRNVWCVLLRWNLACMREIVARTDILA